MALSKQIYRWIGRAQATPAGALAVDAAMNIALGQGGDVYEGVAAFLEKRTPVFPGKASSDMPENPWW